MYDFMSEGGWQHYGKGLAAYQAGWRMQPERPSPAAEQGAAQSGAEPPTGEHDQVMQNFTRSIPNSKQSSRHAEWCVPHDQKHVGEPSLRHLSGKAEGMELALQASLGPPLATSSLSASAPASTEGGPPARPHMWTTSPVHANCFTCSTSQVF